MSLWTPRTTDELVADLRAAGTGTPLDLAEEFVRRGPAVVEPLCAVLRDPAAWEIRRTPEDMFPIHALLLLGAIADPRALPALLETTRTRDLEEYSHQDVPPLLARFGPSILQDLAALLHDATALCIGRFTAARAMYLLACDHPALRAEVMDQILGVLRDPEVDPALAFDLGWILEDMAEPEAIEAMRDAIDRGLLEGEFDGVPERLVAGTGWQWDTFERDPMRHFAPGGTLEIVRERERSGAEWRRREREKAPVTRLAPAPAPPTVSRPPQRAATKVGRNDPCPCGSGKKYKKCCG